MVLTLIRQPGYYQHNVDEPLEAMIIAGWWDELGHFPEAALKWVFAEWLRTKTTAPSVAGLLEILRRCIARPFQPFKPAIVPAQLTDVELVRRREIQPELRREFPMLQRMTTTEAD